MIGWLDCSAGISGDMLLGAVVDAGADLPVLQAALDTVLPGAVRLVRTQVRRAGLAACKVDVEVLVPDQPRRTWSQIRQLLQQAALAPDVRTGALASFSRLADAEAAAHGVAAEQVHFHEVGALDAIADVVGGVAGLHALGLTSLTASTVTLGSGHVHGAHGRLPVPAPAVVSLLSGAAVQAGPVAAEMTTPTGAALLAAHVTTYGPLPQLVLRTTGVGAGTRDPDLLPNVLRLLVGEPVGELASAPDRATLLETNVDDLDPRVWPGVLQALLQAGADDAWLTPILMKKGRPAHTLSVLCPPAAAAVLRAVVFTQTTSLGLRERLVDKHALHRTGQVVHVDGQAVRIKLGWLDGRLVNAMPEWDDVAAAARVLGWPTKQVLARAQALAQEQAPSTVTP